jgi:hypothetical protein
MELGRWQEAAVRLIESLDRDPGDPSLVEAAVRLLAVHPQPEILRAWLIVELEKPEHDGAAQVIGPLLSAPS